MKILGRDVSISVTKGLGTSTLTRDNKGNVTGSTNGYSVSYDIDRYLSAFRSVYSAKNYVTLFHTMSELQFPIRMITDRVLNAEFNLKDFDTDSIIWDNEPINRFLSQPNAFQTFNEFIEKLIAYYFVCGESFLYSALPDSLAGNSNERWKWCDDYHVLPADCMNMVYPMAAKIFSTLKRDDIIEKYTLLSGMGNQDFNPNNILHFRDTNLLFDRYVLKGRSRLSSLEYPLSNLCAVYEARNVIYVKRGAIGAIISDKSDSSGTVALTKTEQKELQKDFNDNYGLESKKDPFMIAKQPIKFERFSMSIEELKPFEETLADAIQIASEFNIPACLVPANKDSTFNNQDAAEKSLYNNTVIPFTNKIIMMLNSFLGLRQGKGGMYLSADFSKVPVLQTNKKDNAVADSKNTDTVLKQYKAGVCTKNQMRIKMGWTGIKGEDFYIDKDPNKDIILNIKETINLPQNVQ
jgi:phage portal protein BeeE